MTLTFNEQEYNGQGYDRSNDPFKIRRSYYTNIKLSSLQVELTINVDWPKTL